MIETELEPGVELIPEETCDHPEDQREYTNREEPFCLLAKCARNRLCGDRSLRSRELGGKD